jgi:fructokinase
MDDVLVIGEALVDIVERPDGGRAEHPGGSPANVALGLARLGRSAHLLTRIGDDQRGHAVAAHLQASGVVLVPGSITAERTSTATAHLDGAGVATYDFDLDWRLPATVDPTAFRAVHTGSIAAFLEPGATDVLALLDRAAGLATISYDPNARPRLMGGATAARQRVESIVARAHVVKVSDEDLAWLAPGEDHTDIARRWLESGPSVVVVTRGGQGAFGLCAAGEVDIPAPRIEVVDTVGAGDAFTAGLLDHLAGAELLGPDRLAALGAIETEALATMLTHAAQVAAITCTRAGAQPPTRAELSATA